MTVNGAQIQFDVDRRIKGVTAVTVDGEAADMIVDGHTRKMVDDVVSPVISFRITRDLEPGDQVVVAAGTYAGTWQMVSVDGLGPYVCEAVKL